MQALSHLTRLTYHDGKESPFMPNSESFDAVVVGTGQAGKPLALALAEAGYRTAVLERQYVGGSCINYGCTPTKTLIASARAAHVARRGPDYGVETGEVSVDQEVVRERKRTVVEQFRGSGRKGLEKAENVSLIFGHGRLAGPNTVEVELTDGGTRTLTADKIFLNTGTRPRRPDLPGLHDVDPLDNRTIMELGETPRHLLILGGGYIGLEFGQMFRRFGSDVTIVQRGSRLVSSEDEDVSDALAEILREDGVEVLLDASATRAERDGDEVVLHVEAEEGERSLRGSHLLVATGRTVNTDDLGLEAAGVATDDRGYVQVNDRLETNVPGIWALGDMTGGPAFTHVSYDDFRVVKDRVLDGGDATTRGRLVPFTLFTDPQLGRVGLTEREARERGKSFRVAKLPMSHVARAIETDETRGFMKALVEDDTDQILGCAMLGIEGGEVASVVQVAMMGKLPYTALRDGVFAHPTLAESLNNLFTTLDD